MIVLAGAVRGDLALNAQLTEACCAAAAQAGIGQVLLASSSAVYGVNGGLPCREDTPTHPVNDYGRAKLEAEAVADRWRARGLAITALRIGNVAGADALLGGMRPGEPTRIDRFADGGSPVRSYIGPVTLADVLAKLLGQDPATCAEHRRTQSGCHGRSGAGGGGGLALSARPGNGVSAHYA